MKKYNLVFDDDLDHVDILGIPDNLVCQIDFLSQKYLDWCPPDDNPNYRWTFWDAIKLPVKGGNDFVYWLNEEYCQGDERAFVELSDTCYNPQYPIIEF